jgi:hypothetical protein
MRFRHLLPALPIAWLAAAGPAPAEWKLPESVQVHGFASQGFIKTTGNNFFGDSRDGSFDFRELGINGSWRPVPNLLLSAQAVSRNAGSTDDGDLRIDYALVDYSLVSDLDTQFGLRLGRVVNPFGLYNDTRDVAFTRPSILLPQSIYFDINRQLALSGDGVHLYAEQSSSWGGLLFQGGLFKPRTDDPDFELSITQGLVPTEVEGKASWIGRLIYEYDGGRLRLAATAVDLEADFRPELGPDFTGSGKFGFSPLIFSAQYNAERWSLTGEYARRPTSLKDFGALLPDTEFTGESYYLQGTFRFTPDIEGVLRYDVLVADRDDPDGEEFAAVTGLPAHGRFAKDWTVGLRWDVTPSFMLQAEYHYIDGTGWMSPLENPGEQDQRWDLFAIMASYRF